jgi:AcrR family transcriptional regulator
MIEAHSDGTSPRLDGAAAPDTLDGPDTLDVLDADATPTTSAAGPASGRTPRARRRDGELTRQRVLDAAVASIVEIGYYQSSSNEIARRAGVTWGVLQHQFGTREGLLLEVLDDRWERLRTTVADAEITGETLEARLHAVLDVLDGHYGQPEHLVVMQISLDLANNPRSSTETRAAVREHARRFGRAWQPLCVQALGESAGEPDLINYAFTALRGYLVGNLIASSFGRPRDDSAERELLVRGVAASISAEAQRRGLPVP